MKLLTIAIFGIVLILPCSVGQSAEVYFWTDENGVKHYSNTPPDEENAQVEFKEYQHSNKTDRRRTEDENEELESLINDIEHKDRMAKAAEEKRRAEAEKNTPTTKEERIEVEKKKLITKIGELEEQPLEYFGSQKNKRVRIGYYKYRLETLEQDPEKYFKEPTRFEGNVKNPDDSDTN